MVTKVFNVDFARPLVDTSDEDDACDDDISFQRELSNGGTKVCFFPWDCFGIVLGLLGLDVIIYHYNLSSCK